MNPQNASPQTGKGHGHTEISNELLEAIYRYPWRTAVGLRAVLWIMRDSYGWKRKETRALGFPEVAEILEADRVAVFKAFRSLTEQGIVERGPNGGWIMVKNYLAWGKTPQLSLIDPVDKSVDNVDKSLPTGNGCPQATESRCLQATENAVSGNGSLPTGNAYRRNKGKERKKGAGTAQAPQSSRTLPTLPNGKFDSPRHRAELGNPELAPEDHGDFKRMSFKHQDDLTEEWKGNRERWTNKYGCRKACGRPRASDTWHFCRECTVCSECEAKPGGGLQFTARGPVITCAKCAPVPTATK